MKVSVLSDGKKLQNNICSILEEMGIEICDVISETIEEKSLVEADVLVSVCYHSKVNKDILSKYPLCINFHPAPLPDYKGFAVYNFGLYNKESRWGVTAHHMTDDIDCGDIIEVSYFDIEEETVSSLKQKSHSELISLFRRTMSNIKEENTLPRKENIGGRNYTRKMFDEFREINTSMSSYEVDKRIHSFHCPPHSGAFIIIDDKKYYFNY